MMLGQYQRCISCMKEIGTNNVCPHCGYIEGSPFLPDYLPPKTVLNHRYIVGKLLSYNGEGAVYIAFDTVIESAVEIREYMPDALCSRLPGGLSIVVNQGRETQYKALMSDYIDLMRQLTKIRTLTTVVQAYEVFEENNTAYAVFEHVEGITLRQYLNDNAGEISWETASKILMPLFGTLSALHSSNLVHRGISPETILLSIKGELKLTGFSISSLRATGTELSPQLYSGYAAPEQYSSNSWHGTWTDVYALAAVIYKSLTGTMPPDATTRSVNDNLIEPHILNPDVPKQVSAAIMAAMLLSPEQRTQTVIELRNHLHSADPIPVVTPIVKPDVNSPIELEEEEEEKKSFPAWAIALIVTSAVLIIVLILLLVLMLGGNEDVPDRPTYSYSSSEIVSEVSSQAPISSKTTTSIDMKDFSVESFIGLTMTSVRNNTTFNEKYTIEFVEEWNESYGEGIIFKQDPVQDTPVNAHDKVTLYVSKGSRFVEIPEHNNIKQEDYEFLLFKAGISNYTVTTEPSENIRAGYITRVEMNGNTYDKENVEANQLVIYVAEEKAADPTTESVEDATESREGADE